MDMRKHLRKPAPPQPVTTNWVALYGKALEMTADIKSESDPRVKFLRGADPLNPEAVLRKLSIISPVDLEREFKGK